MPSQTSCLSPQSPSVPPPSPLRRTGLLSSLKNLTLNPSPTERDFQFIPLSVGEGAGGEVKRQIKFGSKTEFNSPASEGGGTL
jgi:hypothetical protein